MNKLGASTMTGVVMTMLLVFGAFTGMFLWVQQNAESSGVTLDADYEEAFNNIGTKQTYLDTQLKDIQANFNDAKEAEGTFFAVWNGMVGVGNTILLMTSFVAIGVDMVSIIVMGEPIIPNFVLTLITMATLVVILFTLIGAAKGEGRM